MAKKKILEKSWKEELGEIFKEEIDEYGSGELEYFLSLYPTKESWIEVEEAAEKSDWEQKLFNSLRLNFKDDDEFEQFMARAQSDTDALKKYLKDEDVEEFSKFLRREKGRSSGTRKLVYYFRDLLKNVNFQKEIRELREKYKIPKDGFFFSEKDYDKFLKNSGHYIEEKDLDKVTANFGLYDFSWYTILEMYIFFNHIDFKKVSYYTFLRFDLCKVVDEKHHHEEDFSKETGGHKTDKEIREFREMMVHIREREDLQFPVSLRISPYASERDIIDFIKKNFSEISDKQKRYRLNSIMIGKVRKKSSSILERNEFIYKNRALSSGKLQTMVRERFGELLDYTYVNKIIADMKKKLSEHR